MASTASDTLSTAPDTDDLEVPSLYQHTTDFGSLQYYASIQHQAP